MLAVAVGALVGSMGCVGLDAEAELGTQDQALVGGTATTAAEFPGVVLVLITPGEICTGTLIHQEWVLTAAHCLTGKVGGNVQVLFDKLDLKATGGVAVNASMLVMHPQFDAAKLGDNDIAIIKLETPQPKRTRHPIYREAPMVGGEFTQVGYGAVAAPSLGSGIQRKLVTRSAACSSLGAGNLDPTQIMCFGADDGNGTCFGDSGGPTFIKSGGALAVAGVTSFGADTQCTGYDAITQVPAEASFLDLYVPKFTPVNTSGDVPPSQDDVSGGCAAGGGSSSARASLFMLTFLLLCTRRRARRA
jgi:trypsin